MDAFNSKDFYGHSLSEDPKLRTTARNYEFKYNSSDHLERIINRVRMDRETKKQKGTFHGQSKHRGPCFKTESSQLLTPPIVHTQVGRLNSRETIVKIMSDEDIEALVSQALNSEKNLDPVMVNQNSVYDLPAGHVEQINHVEPEEIRKEVKTSKFALELLPAPQPKWVEIKPIQKAFSSTCNVPAATGDDVLSDCEKMSGLNLSCDSTSNEVVQSKQTPDRAHLVDAFSLDSEMTEDFVIRNQDLSEEEEEPAVERPFSPEIDLNLNECEQLEMERVFGKALPQISPLDFGKFDRQVESEYSEPEIEKDDKGFQEHAAGLTDEEFYIQPVVHIQHHLSKPSPGRSERSANSSLPRTSRSTKKSHRSMEATTFRSSAIALETPVEKRLRNQMESLKQEKMRIFSKMTSTQGNIVEALDSLRQSLLRVSLTYDQAEKTSRERNGLEFCVRFSRNYLFPLEKMIEKLRMSPEENYHSALTNEPCVKVCGIYGLLSQALECYQKQLRHFFTDNVPKKLDVLLNMIKDTTSICLEKNIFDQQDTLIQCLLSRCDVFLEFVMEFEENKKSARKEESVWSTHRDQHKLSKTSSKWDLTMSLNKLNMYEPKLVQKKPKKKIERKITQPTHLRPSPKPKKVKKQKFVSNDKKDQDDIMLPNEDPIETQVRKDNMIDSVELINAAISEHPDSELANSVIETLQDITKDEVRQIFGPIVSNLGSILKSSVSFVSNKRFKI